MPQERIPFGNQQASGFDELGGASPIAMNVVTEIGTGAVRRRPGITSYFASAINSQGISGLYETVDGVVFAVAGTTPQRNIYRVSATSSVNLSTGPSTDLRGSRRPVFAETESILVIAAGLEPQKVLLPRAGPQGATSYASSRLGGTPPQGSHIIAMNDRLFGNDVNTILNNVQFSDQAVGSSYAGFEDWTTSLVTGFFLADARPDPLVSLHENTNEAFCFGSSSLQVFAPGQPASDGSAQFPPVVTTEVGCAAPYSVVKVEQNFALLDDYRRFALTDGRTQSVISDPIQRTLNALTVVSDCFGYRVVLGNLDLLIWTFPTEQRSFCYQKGAGWSEWSGWDSTASNWSAFSMTAATPLKTSNDVLIGTSAGLLGTLDFDATSDFDGPDINAFVETGFISRGTENRKTCKSVTFALRRGETTTDEEPYLLVSWRDSPGPWEPAIQVSLGSAGEHQSEVQLYSLGVYRRRQWRLDFTGAESLIVAAVFEDFTVEAN